MSMHAENSNIFFSKSNNDPDAHKNNFCNQNILFQYTQQVLLGQNVSCNVEKQYKIEPR